MLKIILGQGFAKCPQYEPHFPILVNFLILMTPAITKVFFSEYVFEMINQENVLIDKIIFIYIHIKKIRF